MANNFQRLFYILKNMDSDSGYPAGYLRFEINSDDIKLQIALNNLLDRKGWNYQLVGIGVKDDSITYTVICDIPYESGKADIKINLNRNEIGSNSLSFDDINVFAILIRLEGNKTSIKCPLVTYRSMEVEWRRDFEAHLLREETEKSTEKSTDYTEGEDNSISDINSEENVESKLIETENLDLSEELTNAPTDDTTNNDIQVKIDSEITINSERMDNTESKFESTLTSIYINKDIPASEEIEEEVTSVENEDILSYTERNFKDISSIGIDINNTRKGVSIQSLKEELNKSFETCHPFKESSKSIKWWKVNSPGYLNNILFRNNIKTYLIFNPKVMLAHYKYRYIIFGVRNSKHLGREQLLCGVPGVYNIDENPFGEMGSWAQLEGYKPKYGAFGYWVILIEPKTGKLLKAK